MISRHIPNIKFWLRQQGIKYKTKEYKYSIFLELSIGKPNINLIIILYLWDLYHYALFTSKDLILIRRLKILQTGQTDWYINIAFARGGAHLGILPVDTILDRENHVVRRRVSWWTGNLILSHFDIKIILLV